MATVLWVGGNAGSGSQQNDASNTANYSGAALPTTGDDFYIEANPSGTDYAITAGLTAITNTLNSLNISQTFSKAIGTSSAYFVVRASTVNIGYNYSGATANGSSLIKLNLSSVQSNVTVTNSSTSSAITGLGPIILLGTNANNTLINTGGTMSIANTAGESSTFLTISNGGKLFLGSGVTLTTVNNFGGSALIRSAATTITCTAGSIDTEGSGAVTTLSLNGGTATLDSTGTITTLNVYGGTADFSNSPAARTVTTANVYAGTLTVNNGVKGSITFTNPIHTFGSNYRLTTVPGSSLQIS